jgi:CRP-like cAMP-binding protein
LAGDTPAFIRRIAAFGQVNDDDLAQLRAIMEPVEDVPARTDLVAEGDERDVAYAVEDGWVQAFKDMEDGRRQIIGFQIPGDSVGLRTHVLRTADHAFTTLTRCRLQLLRKGPLEALLHERPRLAAALFWSLAREEAVLVEHLVSLGRRSAHERLSHLLCELGCRLVSRGLGREGGFHCPAPQSVLADALGLSVVHLNRTLRPMRESGLVEVGASGIDVPDLARLIEEAGFDPRFLGLFPGDGSLVDHML